MINAADSLGVLYVIDEVHPTITLFLSLSPILFTSRKWEQLISAGDSVAYQRGYVPPRINDRLTRACNPTDIPREFGEIRPRTLAVMHRVVAGPTDGAFRRKRVINYH